MAYIWLNLNYQFKFLDKLPLCKIAKKAVLLLLNLKINDSECFVKY